MQKPSEGTVPRTPSVAFVSHADPMLALDEERGRSFRTWTANWTVPKAILAVSAHWERTPARLGTTETRPLLYDFRGFPDELSCVVYAAPGAPELAARVRALLPGVQDEATRPWDHGVWVPLVHMFPRADVPVLQLSLPSTSAPREIFALGRKLAPLADEGVVILASGGMVHNLRSLAWEGSSTAPTWATDFEAWMRAALSARDVDLVLDCEDKAPAIEQAHPTREHLQPLFFALGAAAEATSSVTYPIEGFDLGSLSRLCVELA